MIRDVIEITVILPLLHRYETTSFELAVVAILMMLQGCNRAQLRDLEKLFNFIFPHRKILKFQLEINLKLFVSFSRSSPSSSSEKLGKNPFSCDF